MTDIQIFIDGEWRASSSGRTRNIVNPATEEVVGQLAVADDADLDAAAQSSQAAFKRWKRTSALERGAILRKASQLLKERANEIAKDITRENGKTIAESTMEAMWAGDYFDWYAEESRRIYGRTIPARAPGVRQMTVREPIGPVLALSPWNWPLVTMCRKIAPALAAGCTVIAKPAEETPSAGVHLVKALTDAGVPAGVVNLVYGDPAHISARLIASPEIRKISFTGSVPVGRLLARQAAENLKAITLELGGHAPVIVFADADIDDVVKKVVPTKFRTSGQVCSSPTRFYVHESIADKFSKALGAAAGQLKAGDGAAAGNDLGPLISARRLAAVTELVDHAVSEGAGLLTGGKRVGDKGYFYAPTVLANVKDDARIMVEEPFGPIALVSTFSTYDEVIERANANRLGLAGYVFTGSLATAQRVAADLECGNIGINTFGVSIAEAPFGGLKDSGSGKEGGIEGIESYLVTKFVAEAAPEMRQ